MADFTAYRVALLGTDYPSKYDSFVLGMQDYATEIENGRQGQASLTANFNRYFLKSAGFTQSMSLNGYRLTGAASGSFAADELIPRSYADNLSFSAALPSQAGNGGLTTRTNGSVTSWDNWYGDPVSLTAAGTLTDRTAYHANTSAGPFSVNLPAIGSKSWVIIRDVGLVMSSKPLTLVPNGTDKVYGSVQNYVMNMNGEALILVVDPVKGWVRG